MNVRFGSVMLPVDFSAHSDIAAGYATWFVQKCGPIVHLVHVIANPLDPLYEPESAVRWLLVEHAEKKANEWLQSWGERSLPLGCQREHHIAHGDPYGKLLEFANQISPDVIVMSTHGRSGIAHLLIGSVAEKLVRHAPCPVFVIHRPLEEKQ